MRSNGKLTAVLALAVAGVTSAGLTGTANATERSSGAVYTSTNSAAGNEVVVFERGHGSLVEKARVATGGLGTGAGLGSQGAVTLADHGGRLLVVNAGSDDVSLFKVTPTGLTLLDTAPSGGDVPISVTAHGNLAYVVNSGGAANVSGFQLTPSAIEPLAGSTQALSVAGPAQVQFTRDGDALVVTGKASNSIDVFRLEAGRPIAPVTSPSAGTTPFGFDFDTRGHLLVSDAAGGAPGASTASSYTVEKSGALTTITGAVPDHQAAACWLVSGRHFAYVTNTGSGTVSSYAIAHDGSLSLVRADAGTTGGAPTDEALSGSGRRLYVVDSSLHQLTGFRTRSDGSLELVASAPLPAAAVGLAAS